MPYLGKIDFNLASRISCSLNRTAIPSFIYSWSTYLTIWWWLTNNQSVGLLVYFKDISSGESDEIPPISAGTNLFKKTSCQQERNSRGLTKLIIPLAGPEKFTASSFSEMLGKCRKSAAFHQLGINYEADWGVYFFIYSNRSRCMEWQKPLRPSLKEHTV